MACGFGGLIDWARAGGTADGWSQDVGNHKYIGPLWGLGGLGSGHVLLIERRPLAIEKTGRGRGETDLSNGSEILRVFYLCTPNQSGPETGKLLITYYQKEQREGEGERIDLRADLCRMIRPIGTRAGQARCGCESGDRSALVPW